MRSHASSLVLMIWLALSLPVAALFQTADDVPIVVQQLSDRAFLFKLAFLQTSVLVGEEGVERASRMHCGWEGGQLLWFSRTSISMGTAISTRS